MTHEELIDTAAVYALDALDGEEQLAFEAHLRECAVCRAEVDAYREAAGLLALTAPPARPRDPAAMRERLLARARLERAPAAPGPSPVPVAPATDPAPRTAPPVVGQVPARRGADAAWGPWLAAAACLVVALASTLAWRGSRSERARLEAQLAVTRAELARRDSVLSAFFGPEVHVVSLSAPQAKKPSLRVFWNHTRKVFIVTAHALPVAPPGKTYQLWAMRNGKPPLSMGTFHVGPNGRALAILPVGNGINDGGFIDDCALTVEPAGGSPQPTESPRLIGAWRHVD